MRANDNVTQDLTDGQKGAERRNYYFDFPNAIYYPFKLLPDFKLEVYADACLTVALTQSKSTQQALLEILLLWESPGGRALIKELNRLKFDLLIWFRKRNEALMGNKQILIMPQIIEANLKDAINKFNDVEIVSYQAILNGLERLIASGFNRKIDIENKTQKIFAEKSPYLFQEVVNRSLTLYLLPRPRLEPKVFSDAEIAEFAWFYSSVNSNHSTRISRTIINTMHKKGFSLQHPSKILDDAEMWYRARVFCNTAREAADYYHIDPIDLSKRIEPFDDATGWPRHK